MTMKLNSWLLACMLSPFCACSFGTPLNNTTVENFDVKRYMGTWYELARYDHRFERDMDNCMAFYTLKDGKVTVANRGIKNGKSKVTTGTAKLTDTPGLLRVSFFWPFYSDYRVMMLASDYSYALVGSGNAKYLWILSRTPKLPQYTINKILAEASRRGYDTHALIWVNQDENMGNF